MLKQPRSASVSSSGTDDIAFDSLTAAHKERSTAALFDRVVQKSEKGAAGKKRGKNDSSTAAIVMQVDVIDAPDTKDGYDEIATAQKAIRL
jgi:hypothetical protein